MRQKPDRTWSNVASVLVAASVIHGCSEQDSPASTAGKELVFELSRIDLRGLPAGYDLLGPRSVAVDERGWTYISDDERPRIEVFDSAGSHVRTIGQKGSGPGEFVSPDIGVGAGHLYVHDGQLSRVSMFDTAGRMVWTRESPCCLTTSVRVDSRGNGYLLQGGFNFSGNDAAEEFLIVDTLGKYVGTISRPAVAAGAVATWRYVGTDAALSVPIPFTPAVVRTVSRVGTVLYGLSSEPRIVETRGREETVHPLRSLRPVAIPDEARQRAIDDLVDRQRRFVGDVKLRRLFEISDVPVVAPTVIQLDVDDCGRLWVARSDGRVDGQIAFDVLDANWNLLGSGSLAGVFFRHPVFAAGHNRLALVLQDSEGAAELAVFRIAPAQPGCPNEKS